MNNLSDYKYPEFNEDFEGMIPASSGGGGSGGVMYVTITAVPPETENYDWTYVADKTFAEVMAAIESGIIVVAKYNFNVFYLNYIGEARVQFIMTIVNGVEAMTAYISYHEGDEIMIHTSYYPPDEPVNPLT